MGQIVLRQFLLQNTTRHGRVAEDARFNLVSLQGVQYTEYAVGGTESQGRVPELPLKLCGTDVEGDTKGFPQQPVEALPGVLKHGLVAEPHGLTAQLLGGKVNVFRSQAESIFGELKKSPVAGDSVNGLKTEHRISKVEDHTKRSVHLPSPCFIDQVLFVEESYPRAAQMERLPLPLVKGKGDT